MDDDVPSELVEVVTSSYRGILTAFTAMKRTAVGACVALTAEGKCSIYARRPKTCREYALECYRT